MFKYSLTVDYYPCNTAPPSKLIWIKKNWGNFSMRQIEIKEKKTSECRLENFTSEENQFMKNTLTQTYGKARQKLLFTFRFSLAFFVVFIRQKADVWKLQDEWWTISHLQNGLNYFVHLPLSW